MPTPHCDPVLSPRKVLHLGMYRSARRFTVSDWIICPSLMSQPRPPPPLIRTQQQRDLEEIALTGRTAWRPVPKDKHILRMYISAALSVFADVMRPHLEKRLGRLLTTFAETVEEMLPYWDSLSRESQNAWTSRAKHQRVQNHYIYLRVGSTQQPMGKLLPKKNADVQEEVDDYETDPDELPGEVCDKTTPHVEEKPLNWVTGARHLMPRKVVR